MFTAVKNAFKVKDIRKKIFFTLFVLIVYRIGAAITVPGVNAAALQEISSTGLASILNTFSGGGLENYSLFAMGVSPYITAQIVVQLLQMDIKDLIALYRKKSIVIGRMVYYHDKLYKAIGVSNLGYLILKNEIEEICISCDEINLKESLR